MEGWLNHYLKSDLYARVQEDHTFFDFLQEGSLDGIFYRDLHDPDHQWMNPALWRLVGHEPATRRHETAEWESLVHTEDLSEVQLGVGALVSNPNKAFDQIIRLYHRLGHVVWVRCRGLAIRDPQGSPQWMLGALTDLTELMHSRIQLESQVQRLEALEMQLELETQRRRTLEKKVADLEGRGAAGSM